MFTISAHRCLHRSQNPPITGVFEPMQPAGAVQLLGAVSGGFNRWLLFWFGVAVHALVPRNSHRWLSFNLFDEHIPITLTSLGSVYLKSKNSSFQRTKRCSVEQKDHITKMMLITSMLPSWSVSFSRTVKRIQKLSSMSISSFLCLSTLTANQQKYVNFLQINHDYVDLLRNPK